MDRMACRLQHGAHEGDGRALAIGARHMDDGWQTTLRIAQSRQQTGDPVQ